MEEVYALCNQGVISLIDDEKSCGIPALTDLAKQREEIMRLLETRNLQADNEKKKKAAEAMAALQQESQPASMDAPNNTNIVNSLSKPVSSPTTTNSHKSTGSNPTEKLDPNLKPSNSNVPTKSMKLKGQSAVQPLVGTRTSSTTFPWYTQTPLSSISHSPALPSITHADSSLSPLLQILKSTKDPKLYLSRCKVFESFWSKGSYLTNGLKFGGDFLLYSGEPLKHHSTHVIKVLDPQQLNGAETLITYGRLANNVRKSWIVCAWDEDKRKVVSVEIKWTGR
ncbi:tRNA-splicing endonuclease subunit [Chytridiales sp. JEL 0842]|nr:tRNA-splicing endonuclease subunit [Chytridiales sp. JEL 0842]